MTTLIPSRVALVDKNAINLLIRGNIPLVDGKFAYDQIAKIIGYDLTKYRLIDVSFIDNVGERGLWAAEMKAFGGDPDKFPKTSWPPYLKITNWNPPNCAVGNDVEGHPGSFVWWPFEGLGPNDDPKVFLHSPGWDFAGCVDYLNQLFNDTSKPTAIFFHCMLGADRTGAAHMCYLIKHKNMSPDAAAQVSNTCTSAGAPNKDYQSLIKAFINDLGR